MKSFWHPNDTLAYEQEQEIWNSSRAEKQQCSKTIVTLILLIQWSCSLYRWKAYKILHNFLIENFSKFRSLEVKNSAQ